MNKVDKFTLQNRWIAFCSYYFVVVNRYFFDLLGGRIGSCLFLSGDHTSLLFIVMLIGGSRCIVIIC